MDKNYIENLQNVILEDAADELLAEGFLDRLKARASGAWAGAKQGAVNAKNAVKGAYRGLKHGVTGEEGADEDIADAHATSGSAADASQNARTATWKKSMTQKINKFVNNTKDGVEEFLTEIKSDAQKLGLGEDVIADIERNAKAVTQNLGRLGNDITRMVMNSDEVAAHKTETKTSGLKKANAERKAAAQAKKQSQQQ